MATGPGVRLRRRPRAGRVDHLADDRHRLQALRRAGRRSSARTRATPATPRRTSGSCASTPPPTTRCARLTSLDKRRPARWRPRRGRTCIKLGEKNGWRNAQASVLAPTGTIGFMMDCDTTGIEPDFSLVKFKKLVGGGSMQIVNQTIPRALRKLGYTEETDRGDRRVHRRARPRHRRPGPASPSTTRSSTARWASARSAPMGHVRMMAAVPAVPVRRDLQDGQPAGDGHGRGDRGRLPAGLEARPQGARGLPRQLQGRPAALATPRRQAGRRAAAGRREGRRVPADPQAAAEEAPVARRSRSPSAAPRAT